MASLKLFRNHRCNVQLIRCLPSFVSATLLKSTNVDVFESFTTVLLRRIQEKRNPSGPECTPLPKVDAVHECLLGKLTKQQITNELIDIRQLSADELNSYVNLIITTDDRHRFNHVIDQFHQYRLLPRDDFVLRSLRYLCDDTQHSMPQVVQLIDVCREKNLKFYATDMEFAPFLAQCLWQSNRYDSAMSVLRDTYVRQDNAIKANVRQNFQRLLKDAIEQRIEGDVKSKIKAFAMEIYEQHRDHEFMADVFNRCFASEWYEDQVMAVDLFRQHECLRIEFQHTIGPFTYDRLQSNNVDAVQRLVELCLEFKFMDECHICLTMLFDYQCKYEWTLSGLRI